MSVVPPSPPWATTRTSLSACPAFSARTLSAAAIPVPTAAALPNSEWIHGSCHDDSG